LSASRRSMNPEVSSSRSRPRAHFSASSRYINVRDCVGKPFRLTLTCHCKSPRRDIVAIPYPLSQICPNKYYFHSSSPSMCLFLPTFGTQRPEVRILSLRPDSPKKQRVTNSLFCFLESPCEVGGNCRGLSI
jgi:hypothetical protein